MFPLATVSFAQPGVVSDFCQASAEVEGDVTLPYLAPFLRTFQQPNPFCCNKSTTILFIFPFSAKH
jgi:hypothetical protein